MNPIQHAQDLQKVFDKLLAQRGAGAAPSRFQITKVGTAPIDENQIDPTDMGASYVNTGHPLFSTMALTDLNQFKIANCYFLAAIGALVNCANGRAYLPTIVYYDPSDPTKVIVCYQRNGVVTRIHCDLLVATNVQNQFDPADSDLYVELLEKTYALYREGADTFTSENYGFSSAVFSDIGCGPSAIVSIQSGNLIATMRQNMANQIPMTIATTATPMAGLIESHEYVLQAVNADNSILLFNPWGSAYPPDQITIQPANLTAANFPYIETGVIPIVAPPQPTVASLTAKLSQALTDSQPLLTDIQNIQKDLGLL